MTIQSSLQSRDAHSMTDVIAKVRATISRSMTPVLRRLEKNGYDANRLIYAALFDWSGPERIRESADIRAEWVSKRGAALDNSRKLADMLALAASRQRKLRPEVSLMFRSPRPVSCRIDSLAKWDNQSQHLDDMVSAIREILG